MKSKFLSRSLDLLLNLALYVDFLIRKCGSAIFRSLPRKLQAELKGINDEFLLHRDRFLGIPGERVEASSNASESSRGQTESGSRDRDQYSKSLVSERGDIPGWVLVVLMTTGLVTALWTIAAPRLSQILRNSLDSMNNIR